MIIQLVIIAPIYLLPGIICQLRKHKSATAIWLLNILLGWTGLGWLALGAWAIFGQTRAEAAQAASAASEASISAPPATPEP